MLYDNGYESDSDIEDYGEPTVSGAGYSGHGSSQEYGYTGFDSNWDGDIAVELKGEQFKNFTEEQKDQITKQLEIFRQEKKNFDREVLKWDDKGNDIIVLAKQMCVIMMEMTDFTRGRGMYNKFKEKFIRIKSFIYLRILVYFVYLNTSYFHPKT